MRMPLTMAKQCRKASGGGASGGRMPVVALLGTITGVGGMVGGGPGK